MISIASQQPSTWQLVANGAHSLPDGEPEGWGYTNATAPSIVEELVPTGLEQVSGCEWNFQREKERCKTNSCYRPMRLPQLNFVNLS